MHRLSTVCVSLLFALALGSGVAQAAPKKKAGKGKPAAAAQAKAVAATTDEKVASLMGDFKWGMSTDEVFGVLFKQIDVRYMEQIKEATGNVYKQDTLRKTADKEKARIKKSFIEFNGQKTPWEVSIIEGEFDHKNTESMVEIREKDDANGIDQRRFFFFKNGQLWKMFVAFDSERFKGKGFADFRAAMEGRFGPGKAETTPKGLEFVHWRSKAHYVRALDLTRFYGNFCLVVSDLGTESTIYEERKLNNPKTQQRNNIVDSVLEDSEKGDSTPPKQDNVVDDIIGGGKR